MVLPLRGQYTIYLYKPSGARADAHSYTKTANDRDGSGYITYHG